MNFALLSDVVNGTTPHNNTNSTSSEECNKALPINIPFIDSVSGVWVVWSIALLFVLLSWVVSFYLIYKHLKYYTQPEHQRYIVRLLCMVPLYSLYSLLSLILHQHQIYFAIARDCYEAYALFMFFKLCESYGGGKDAIVEHFLSQPKLKLTFPLGCWKVQPNELFFTVCKQGMLQYVLIRPIVSIWAAVLQMFGAYGDGEFSIDMGYTYASIINNVCVCIALYIVVLFEQAAKELLHPYRPILKFLSVKMVIFLAFWQSIAISFLSSYGWIPSFACIPAGDVAVGLQNLLMCFEMCLVALLHIIAYPYELYRVRALTNAPFQSTQVTVKTSVLKSIANMMNPADLLEDTIDSLHVHKKKKHPSQVPPLPTSASTQNVHSFVTHAGGTTTSTSYPNQFQKLEEEEDGESLLGNAGLEPVSAPPELDSLATPPLPRVPEDFNPRQRTEQHGVDIELDDLADDDELLDELDDDDLDYDQLRR